jgi:hypothetical protein
MAKRQPGCGSWRKNGWKGAPILGFALLIAACTTTPPGMPVPKMQVEAEVFTRGVSGGSRQFQVDVGQRFALNGVADKVSDDTYTCQIDLQDATTFTLACEVGMTSVQDGQSHTARTAPRIYGQLGHVASFFISDKDNQPITGLKVLAQRLP